MSAAVNMHDGRKVSHAVPMFREAVDGCHTGWLILERADQKSHMANHGTIFLEFANQFRFKRISARIETGPELFDGLRDIVGMNRSGQTTDDDQQRGQHGSLCNVNESCMMRPCLLVASPLLS